MIDFNVNLTSGNVGALAGTLTGSVATSKISNVIAYNSDSAGYTGSVTIQTSSGNAGGLIGQTEGTNCNIEKSAAALLVNSTSGNAGGLIGTAEGGAVTACYSGGHTTQGKYTGTVTGDVEGYNITATGGIAGGLIGVAGSSDNHVTVRNSYSTCSATGNTNLNLNLSQVASGFFVMTRRRFAGLLAASQEPTTQSWRKRRRKMVKV